MAQTKGEQLFSKNTGLCKNKFEVLGLTRVRCWKVKLRGLRSEMKLQ